MKVLLVALGGEKICAIGPRIMSAYLKQHNITVDLLLMPFVNPDQVRYFSPHWKFYDEALITKIIAPLAAFVEEKQYDLVGLSLTTNFYDHACLITRLLKKQRDIPIVWGGVHPTVRPEESLKEADFLILGEGEGAFLELVQKLAAKEDWSAIENLAYLENGTFKKNPYRPLIQDLDALPLQDFEFKTQYLAYHYQIKPLTQELLYKILPSDFGTGSYGYFTIATRGCPYKCTYCINSTLKTEYQGKGRMLRKRSYQNVIEELALIKKSIPKLTYFLFSDETFLMGKGLDWIKSFSELYKEKVGLPFSCCLAPEDVSEEALALLIDAGLFHAQMGIQSGSKRTLTEVYDRRDNTNNILKAAAILNKSKDHLMPLYDIILDNPYETAEDQKETVRFLLKLPRPFELQLFSLTWYPGAVLTEKALADGLVDNLLEDVYRKHYNAYDRSNYYNLLISMVPYFSPKLLRKLLEHDDWLHHMGVRLFLKLWLSTRYVSGTKPYQWLKRFMVDKLGVEAPVYASLPAASGSHDVNETVAKKK